MNFEDKYKKYKQKYLNLKDQMGGHILTPEGSTIVTQGRYSKTRIPLRNDTPVEIYERVINGIFPPGLNTFVPYRQNPNGQFELSNTFFSNSRQIYVDIYEQLRLIPHNAWIMCLRYSSEGGMPSDCQIGISGSVKIIDTADGTIDLKRAIRREFEEETGLQIINDIVCGTIQQYDIPQRGLITCIVSRSDISRVNIVPPVGAIVNDPDMRHFKVWCVPYVLDEQFDTFKEHLNTVGKLNIAEENISSLVFIRNDNLRNYIAYSLQ